ncbi:MAG: hypothetical protein WCR58_08205 [Bacteroidales bacterium]|jgi:hypothetical protein|nr:hypothetical protein [Bacteroidales bacterium]MDD3702087.1 hypothetical protein [Bacteroidales bacterium]MDY0369626.1 hypothetical protein [Bacteroidales bacterium]
MKDIFHYTALLVGLLVFVVIFSLISTMLPDDTVRLHIRNSLPDVVSLPDYPEPMIRGRNHSLDYAMDGMITNIIYNLNNQTPIQSVLLCRWDFDESQPYQSQWHNLAYTIEHIDQLPKVVYGRYWHGNSFLFRFLYWMMDYNEIKWMIYFLSSLLFLCTTIFLYKRLGFLTTLALHSGLLFLNQYVMQFSMQLAPALCITLIGMMVVSHCRIENTNKLFTVFLILGALTAYFDLLTVPLLTFGMPFLVWISLLIRENSFTYTRFLRDGLTGGLLWLLAYAFIWASKWVLVAWFTDFHIWKDVQHFLLMRSGATDQGRWDAVRVNFNQMPLVWINLAALLLLLRSLSRLSRQHIMAALGFIAIGLLPYIWFFVMANHSAVHFWFTYRIQAVSISALMLALIVLHKPREKIQIKSKI